MEHQQNRNIKWSSPCHLQTASRKIKHLQNANKTQLEKNTTNKTFQLIKSEETKNAYQQQSHENLCKMECNSWENIRASITDAATKTIGFTKNTKNHRIQNPVVERILNQQILCSTINNEKVRELKMQSNRLLHDIANILNGDKNRELVNLASEIDKCHNDNTKMYRTVKFIDRKPLRNLIVHDKAARNVKEPNAVYNVIRDHFKVHFNDPKESKLEPSIGNPRPLDTPITKDKVAKSIHKLRNNRAPGYEQTPPELLKYAPTELHDLIAEFLNNIFAKHEYINVGHGLLTALQKPKRAHQKSSSSDPLNNATESQLKYCVSQNSTHSRRISSALLKCLSSCQKHVRHCMVP